MITTGGWLRWDGVRKCRVAYKADGDEWDGRDQPWGAENP